MTIRGKAAIAGFHEISTLRQYGERSTTGLLAEVARGAVRDAKCELREGWPSHRRRVV